MKTRTLYIVPTWIALIPLLVDGIRGQQKPKPSVFIEPGIVRCTPEALKAKLRVIRASDGKIVLVDYCAAAEDSNYSEIEKRSGERK